MAQADHPEVSVDRGIGGLRTRMMFSTAVLFLAVFAAILPHGGLAEAVSMRLIAGPFALALLAGLWLVIITEGVIGYFRAPDRPRAALLRLALVVLVPPMRMVISPLRPNTRVWLPRFGWIDTGKSSVEAMERRTAMPMLAMTALIIPVIAADLLTGPRAHDVLAAEMDSVTRFDLSDNGMRLFMMDESQRVVANVARTDRNTGPGIAGEWAVLGRPAGDEVSTLVFGQDDGFTFQTGCSVTTGVFAYGYGALGFNDMARSQTCPPTLLEKMMWFLTALIWFSFAFEFILLVSLAEKKLEFCKRNWINLVIILLPLLAFLRSLQLFRFLRMAKAGKLMRAYRLRGLLTRMIKIAVVFNLIDRLMSRNPEKYDAHLREQIFEKEAELLELKSKLNL